VPVVSTPAAATRSPSIDPVSVPSVVAPSESAPSGSSPSVSSPSVSSPSVSSPSPDDAQAPPADQRAPRLPAHLVLVGLPGSGKTTVGRAVAGVLRWPFVDLDLEIVRRAGQPITAIFAVHGESHFRALEREATLHLREHSPSVIAPGGGWVTMPDTVALLRPPARMTYLKVSPAGAARRLRRSARSRPLLKHDPLGVLERLLLARGAAYENADLVVDTEVLTRQQVIDQIVALVSVTAA